MATHLAAFAAGVAVGCVLVWSRPRPATNPPRELTIEVPARSEENMGPRKSIASMLHGEQDRIAQYHADRARQDATYRAWLLAQDPDTIYKDIVLHADERMER